MARFDTTVWTIAESRNPNARGQRTSQNMKKESCSARQTALSKNTPSS